MSKLKLFSKTYIFTMVIISIIILISNGLIYLALPKVYVNNKQKEADKIIKDLIEQVNKSENKESFNIAKNFAEKYNIQVLLTIGEEKKVFQGSHKVDIYVNKDEITEDSLIIPNLSGENIVESFDYENGERLGQYININNLSIIKSKDFKKRNNISGFRIIHRNKKYYIKNIPIFYFYKLIHSSYCIIYICKKNYNANKRNL